MAVINRRKNKKTRRKFTLFRPRVRSRHPSHKDLTKGILIPTRAVVRFGSTTELKDTTSNGGRRIEVNTVEAIRNCADKTTMKHLMSAGGIKTPKHITVTGNKKGIILATRIMKELKLPMVAKIQFHSRGRGMKKIKTFEELKKFIANNSRTVYMEEFKPYKYEYRIHVSPLLGEIFSVRKLIKDSVPQEERWIRSIANGLFRTDFNKPPIWDTIIKECVKAAKALKVDIGAFDVLYDSKTNDFTILECNSAPSLGCITKEKYKEAVKKIILNKYRL